MKRPMLAIAGVWLTGIFLTKLSLLWIAIGIGCYIILLVLLLLLLRFQPFLLNSLITPKRYAPMTVFFVILPLLFFLAWYRGNCYEAKIQSERFAYEQMYQNGEKKVILFGSVTELQDGEQLRLKLSDCTISGYEEEVERKAGDCYVYINAGEAVLKLREGCEQIAAGNRIRVYGRLQVYQRASNPGQFDAFSYYAMQGVYAGITAIQAEQMDMEVTPFGQAMYYMRKGMTESLCRVFGEKEAGVLNAMLVGDKTRLPEETKELYQKNGISHILAISGLHISLICMGLYRLLRRMGLPRKINSLISAAFLLFYVCYSGGSTSAWRAAIMSLTLLLSYQCRRSYDMLSALAMAAIWITAANPWVRENAGFLLSFGAVFGVALAARVQEQLPKFCSPLVFSASIFCITTPISLWFFYEMSPYSVFINLLILPLVSILVSCGLMAGFLGFVCVPLAAIFAGAAHLVLGWYELLAEGVQKLPYSFILIGRPEFWQMIAYGLILLLALKLLCREYRLAAAMLLIAAWLLLLFPIQKSFGITFLDVSQGDCIVCTTTKETILFDCGSSNVSKVAEYRLVPCLKQQGIALIDIVTVSHMDSDHSNGIQELLTEMQPYAGEEEFYRNYDGTPAIKVLMLPKVEQPSESYLELLHLAKEKQVEVRYLEAGDRLPLADGNTELTCLSPKSARESENDTSLVFLLEHGTVSVWLMGDAGVAAEREIMQREAALTSKICILKAGHHGSNTSSSLEFLNWIVPDVTVISCGYQNRYGHPKEEVLERVAEAGSEMLRTDLQGAVRLFFKNGKLRLQSYGEKENYPIDNLALANEAVSE